MYLQQHQESNSAEQLLSHPEYHKLLSHLFQPFSQELINWINSPYDTNPKHPEHKVHTSSSGNIVRSKSEALIDTLLYMHRIPFRYECALQLSGVTLYPDFTIRHPKSGDVYYWEHFGKMDKPQYAQRTAHKLQLYASHGIIPGIHLITTYETEAHPLSSKQIERIIEDYFL